MPRGSVIICSRNRPQMLRDCVHSVIAGTAQPDEIVVVDQSQRSDPTLEALGVDGGSTCHVRYHWTPEPGLSRAINLAVDLARYDSLVFTHDDVIVGKGWYRSLIGALATESPPIIVTGRVVASDEAIEGGFVPSVMLELKPQRYTGRLDKDVLYPMNMAMHRSTFNLVGHFDERLGPGTSYPAAEDNDYGFRALEKGTTIQYLPQAEVQQRAWRTDVARLRWHYALGQGAFFAKHLEFRDRHMLLRLVREGARYVGLAVQHAGQFDRRAMGYAASAAGLVAGVIRWQVRHALRDRLS